MPKKQRGDKAILAKLLRQFRQARGVTTAELARLADVDENTLSSWLKADHLPREWQAVAALANALRLKIPEAVALFKAAGCGSLADLLQMHTDPAEATLLRPWQDYLLLDKELNAALAEVCSIPAALAQLVQQSLDAPLLEISKSATLRDQIADVRDWAETHNQLASLIQTATFTCPRSTRLADVARSLGILTAPNPVTARLAGEAAVPLLNRRIQLREFLSLQLDREELETLAFDLTHSRARAQANHTVNQLCMALLEQCDAPPQLSCLLYEVMRRRTTAVRFFSAWFLELPRCPELAVDQITILRDWFQLSPDELLELSQRIALAAGIPTQHAVPLASAPGSIRILVVLPTADAERLATQHKQQWPSDPPVSSIIPFDSLDATQQVEWWERLSAGERGDYPSGAGAPPSLSRADGLESYANTDDRPAGAGGPEVSGNSRAGQTTVPVSLGHLVQTIREKRGLDQTEVGTPYFTAHYVEAVEREAVQPSPLALDALARRLGVPASYFLGRGPKPPMPPDLPAIAEDLEFQFNYANMLIHRAQYDEALVFITDAEAWAASYPGELPPHVRYRGLYLRGRIYIALRQPTKAQPELAATLAEHPTDPETQVHLRDVFGETLYLLERPDLALEQHRRCLQSIRIGQARDLNLQLSVYLNLANDYLALGDLVQAAGILHEALARLADVDDRHAQARTYRDLALAYRALGEIPRVETYALQALQIYEESDQSLDVAGTCLILAEASIIDTRMADADAMIKRSRSHLDRRSNLGLQSHLDRVRTLFSLSVGARDEATIYAQASIRSAEASFEREGVDIYHPFEAKTSTYAHALSTAAAVEEVQGNPEAADRLMMMALERINSTPLHVVAAEINQAYADILVQRGDRDRAGAYYRAAYMAYRRGRRSQPPGL